MSYCRNDGIESDVYVIRAHNRKLVCYCNLPGQVSDTEQGMIDHLNDHRQHGHKVVPQRAFDRLEAERDGRPYQTDVEKAIQELRDEGWPGTTTTRPDESSL